MTAMKQGDDPKDFNVDEVNTYLASADESEKARVLEAEAAGKNRSTVKGGGDDAAETPVDVVEGGVNDDGTPQGDQDGGAVEQPPIEAQQAAMEEHAEEQLASVRALSADGDSGPMGAVAGNQQPVTVTGKDLPNRIPKGATIKVTPVVGLDGGDGTRVSAATKTADNVWTPFKAPASSLNGATVAAATVTASTGQKAATIAANALTKY